MTSDNSYIETSASGTMFVGLDATRLVQATMLAAALKLYAAARIIPTRGMTPTRMLALASHYSGKKYRRGEYLRAAADVTTWANAMKAALPVVAR
jgi:hypothetical protein